PSRAHAPDARARAADPLSATPTDAPRPLLRARLHDAARARYAVRGRLLRNSNRTLPLGGPTRPERDALRRLRQHVQHVSALAALHRPARSPARRVVCVRAG